MPESAREKKPSEFIRDYFAEKSFNQMFGVKVDVRPTRFIEQAYFSIHLVTGDLVSTDPVFSGIYSAGRPSQFIAGWVDGDYFDNAVFPNATSLSLDGQGLSVDLFKTLGGLVPPGGSLMVSYTLFSKESRLHRETKVGLDRGYPPAVTPFGFLLFTAGCGMGFKDWYFAEGGAEGPEKLQGFKPLNRHATEQRSEQLLRDVQVFIDHSLADDNLARECISRAEIVVRELRAVRATRT